MGVPDCVSCALGCFGGKISLSLTHDAATPTRRCLQCQCGRVRLSLLGIAVVECGHELSNFRLGLAQVCTALKFAGVWLEHHVRPPACWVDGCSSFAFAAVSSIKNV
jgi:hypothetical protein